MDATTKGSLGARNRCVEVWGVPLDLGQTERGTDVGPAAMRYAGLLEKLKADGHEVEDRGNLVVPASASVPQEERIFVISEVCQLLFEQTLGTLQRGALPLVLGGDHSVAIGSVAASAAHGGAGLLWIDAHADFNTPETSPSGNAHGMPLAVVLGRGHPALVTVGQANGPRLTKSDVVLLGVRQLDREEREALRASGIVTFSMRDIDERGMNAVATDALAHLAHKPRLHVSLDVDALDPRDAPGVGTPVGGGLSFRELHLLLEKVADTGKLSAMDVVEVNPMLDVRNQTAKTAVDLILSALGRAIL